METFYVFHNERFLDDPHDGSVGEFPKDFEKVAIVEAENLERVFYLTNHIDWAWWENPGVILVKESRSTSVGDMVVNVGTRECFRCAGIGWKKEDFTYDEAKKKIEGKRLFRACIENGMGIFTVIADSKTDAACEIQKALDERPGGRDYLFKRWVNGGMVIRQI